MLPSTGFWMGLFWAAAVLLVMMGFARIRARLRERLGEDGLDDDDIRAIEETGSLHRERPEPLDLDAIEEEERRFWETEEWDEADEW
ncbi:MAG: hypothetical protein PVI57_01520 [Gemmatimonadota bacterium]|jgi:hypothetical protein